MDDEFLYAYREEPREAFRRELYERLAHLPVRARRRAQRWLYRGLAVLVLGMVLFLGFSPAARAQIMFIIHQIGGLVYVETTEVPSYGLTPVSFDFGRIEEPAEVPLEEARSLVLFDFMVPTWAPRGYRLLEDKVHVHGVDRVAKVPTDWALVELRWLNDRADIIQLSIRPPAVGELGA